MKSTEEIMKQVINAKTKEELKVSDEDSATLVKLAEYLSECMQHYDTNAGRLSECIGFSKSYIHALLNLKSQKNDVYNDRQMTKNTVIKQEEKRNPSRECILAMMIAMPESSRQEEIKMHEHITIDEINRALKLSGNLALYPRNERDRYIIWCIKEQKNLYEIQEFLEEKKLPKLRAE